MLKWLTLMLALFVLAVVVSGWRAFGHRAEGARLARMQRSPQWHDGSFENPQPILSGTGGLSHFFHRSEHVRPSGPIATVTLRPESLAIAPATGLRVTWLGHSTTLIEIDGARVLTDPMWSERASPVSWLGPTRWYPPLIALAALPHIDVVVISHDHYDHLDYQTITLMKDWETKFVVPLGIGAHLEYWGVPASHIVELDWWEDTLVGGLRVTCTPARHVTGRTGIDMRSKLWSGWALSTSRHRVFFSGDTGMFPAMRDIGQRLGPFDLTMIEVGQYNRAWPDWHIGPEQAVLANHVLRGRVLLPIHWALFALASHGWTEPGERVLHGKPAQMNVALPRPGESFEPNSESYPRAQWWPNLQWETAAEHPILSSQCD